MDILTLAVFAATFATLLAGYALYQSFAKAAARLQLEADSAAMRPTRDGGRYIGGSDKPGSN